MKPSTIWNSETRLGRTVASGPSRCLTDVSIYPALASWSPEQLHSLCSGSHRPELRGRFPSDREQLLTLRSDCRTLPAPSQSWAGESHVRGWSLLT